MTNCPYCHEPMGHRPPCPMLLGPATTEEAAALRARVAELEARIREGQSTLKRRNEECDRYRDALEQIASGEEPGYPGSALTASRCVVLAVEALNR